MADKRDILINLLGTETVSPAADKAGRSMEKLGDRMDATADDAKRLDREIDQADKSLRDLAARYARTQDAAERLDLSKAMRKQQTELRKLTKVKDLLPDFDGAGDEAASGFAARFVGRLGPLLASAPISPAGAAMGVALGAAAAPAIAATISGAVVGGAGIGGVLGGVALAARDPRVKAAGTSLGSYILGDLETRATGFVPPVLKGIADIRAGWKALGPDLDRIFASSRFVDPLVQGAISGGQKLAAGLADAISAAGPATDAVSRMFDGLGSSVGQALSSMADDADEGAAAIDDLTVSVGRFIDTSAKIVHAAASLRGWTEQLDTAIDRGRYWVEDSSYLSGALERVGIHLDLTADGFAKGSTQAEAYRRATLGTAQATDFATLKAAGMTDAEIAASDASGTYRQKLDETNTALGNTATKAAGAATEVRTLGEAIDEATGHAIDSEQANIRLEEAIDNAAEAAKKNGDGIDANIPKQRANREALVGIASAAKDLAAKILAEGGSQEDATAASERGRKKFLETADAMNVKKDKAIELANKLFGIPNVDRTVSVATAKAQAAIAAVQAGLGKIHSKNITVGVYYKSNGDLKLPGGTSLKGAASGGPVIGPGPKGVDSVPMLLAPGEHVLTAREVDAAGGQAGVERIRALLRGENGVAASLAGVASGSRGGGGTQVVAPPIQINASGASGLERVFVAWLVKAIRDGGGNPQVLGLGGSW